MFFFNQSFITIIRPIFHYHSFFILLFNYINKITIIPLNKITNVDRKGKVGGVHIYNLTSYPHKETKTQEFLYLSYHFDYTTVIKMTTIKRELASSGLFIDGMFTSLSCFLIS